MPFNPLTKSEIWVKQFLLTVLCRNFAHFEVSEKIPTVARYFLLSGDGELRMSKSNYSCLWLRSGYDCTALMYGVSYGIKLWTHKREKDTRYGYFSDLAVLQKPHFFLRMTGSTYFKSWFTSLSKWRWCCWGTPTRQVSGPSISDSLWETQDSLLLQKL